MTRSEFYTAIMEAFQDASSETEDAEKAQEFIANAISIGVKDVIESGNFAVDFTLTDGDGAPVTGTITITPSITEE